MKSHLMILFCLSLFTHVNHAVAHEQSVARIYIHQMQVPVLDNKLPLINDTPNFTYRVVWQVSLKDLNRVKNLDYNFDKNIDWGEIDKNKTLLEKIATSSIILSNSNEKCSMTLNNISAEELFNGYALNLRLTANCINELKNVSYHFLNGLDSLHVAQIELKTTMFKMKQLLTHSKSTLELSNKKHFISDEQSFWGFISQGVIHIWIGLDHLLFLVILIFSSLVANISINEKVLLKKSFKKISVYVTAFTLAHTLTLIAASLNWLLLPSWFVESFIAASVALGAFKLLATKNVLNTAMVFNFGLIHGLGFASVLADLTGDISENILLLLGFNLGVEIGQFLFLAMTGAILFISLKVFSIERLKIIISLPVLLIAIIWTVERVFELKIIPF